MSASSLSAEQEKAKSKPIVSYSREEICNMPDESDWERVDAQHDNILDGSELSETTHPVQATTVVSEGDNALLSAETEAFFRWLDVNLVASMSKRKTITISLPEGVIAFFKLQAAQADVKYQTMISEMLKLYVLEQRSVQG
jgi:predicted DNA binding CopG/RHH family protein|tara:strand:- start:765 stop:1187 length:423 start_codon:yes stop_codon:yes gene_type:complete